MPLYASFSYYFCLQQKPKQFLRRENYCSSTDELTYGKSTAWWCYAGPAQRFCLLLRLQLVLRDICQRLGLHYATVVYKAKNAGAESLVLLALEPCFRLNLHLHQLMNNSEWHTILDRIKWHKLSKTQQRGRLKCRGAILRRCIYGKITPVCTNDNDRSGKHKTETHVTHNPQFVVEWTAFVKQFSLDSRAYQRFVAHYTVKRQCFCIFFFIRLELGSANQRRSPTSIQIESNRSIKRVKHARKNWKKIQMARSKTDACFVFIFFLC